MKIDWQTRQIARAVVAAIIIIGGSSAFGARSSVSLDATAVSKKSDILEIERASNGRLLAVGRLDRVSRSRFSVSVLNQKFVLLGTPANYRFIANARVGQPVALFGELNGKYLLVDASMTLDGQYVQGASKVYLRGPVSSTNRNLGVISIGSAVLDTSSFASRTGVDSLAKGSLTVAVGTQPSIGGKVLVESIWKFGSAKRVDASVGTGRPDASVGTGKPDASLGTGRTNASVGTGRPDASVGTGRPDASVGTGKPDASLGTGRTNASVGTGRPNASVGTGNSAG